MKLKWTSLLEYMYLPSEFFVILLFSLALNSQGISLSIGTGYRLDDQGSGVRFLVGAGNVSLLYCIQIGSGAHTTSCPMSTQGSFPGSKGARV